MIRLILVAAIAASGYLAMDTHPLVGTPARVDDRVTLCKPNGHDSELIRVPAAQVAALVASGDYIAGYLVDPATTSAGDGVHFKRITDAVLAARDLRRIRGEKTKGSCRITINVVAGTYTGSFDAGAPPSLEVLPLIIDFPDITLLGALQLKLDGEDRATAVAKQLNAVSTLVPNRASGFDPTEALIVVAGHDGGSAGNGVVIQGFSFGPGPLAGAFGGVGVLSLRVTGLVISGDRFDSGFTTPLDLRASSATLRQIYASGFGSNCGVCLAGPGIYSVSKSRLSGGALGGIYVTALFGPADFSLGASPITTIEPYVLPSTTAVVTADIADNDISGFTFRTVGFAVRIGAIGTGSKDVPQSGTATIARNELHGNTFGVIVNAGQPKSTFLRRGDLNVSLTSNHFSKNCQNDLLVALTRHAGALGQVAGSPFLQNSTFRITLGGTLTWASTWYAHAPDLGNTLIVNGAVIPPGTHVAYDSTKVCPKTE